MKLEFVPLLQVQRDLYRMPRGMERFRAYIQTMVDPETKDLQLPLVAMNPMGIAANLDSKDYPVIITSLFGDVAAASLGYAPLGLGERAGFALALSDALKR